MSSDIEQRLKRLERANHRFRRTILVLVMLVPTMAAVLQSESNPEGEAPSDARGNKPATSRQAERDATAMGRTLEDIRRDYGQQPNAAARGQSSSDAPRRPLRIVDAEVFAVVDHDGKVRTEIGVDDRNASYLRVYDRDGSRRIELVESGGVTTLRLLDAAGTSLVELRQAESGAQISLGAQNKGGKPAVQLISEGGTNGVYLSGSTPNQALSLELDRGEGPQLKLTGAKTHGRYRSNGMHVGSDAGGLSFHLNPGKRAALSFSARSPVAGQEGVEIATSPDSASLGLKSLEHGSNAHLSVQPDSTHFSLKPTNSEAVLQWSIRNHGAAANSSMLMRGERGQESIQIDLDEYGPRMNFFNAKGVSLLSPHPPKGASPNDH